MQDEDLRGSWLEYFQPIYDLIESVRVKLRHLYFGFDVPKYYYKRKLKRR